MCSQTRELTRGRIAKEAGVNIETIRFFERIGLMPNPLRTASGYRIYRNDDLKRLKFIRRTKELGFSNQEIKGLLQMVDGTYACDDVKDIALNNVEIIQKKISDLDKMKDALTNMASECSGGRSPDCAIIDRLFDTP